VTRSWSDETNYAHFYLGDFAADTVHFTASEHRALRRLLLDLWAHGRIARSKLLTIAQTTAADWTLMAPVVIPVLMQARPRVIAVRRLLAGCVGQRLHTELWNVVREIVFERDGHACVYCGSEDRLEGDHIISLSKGGSNALKNVATACRPCNLSKGSRAVSSWRLSVTATERSSNSAHPSDRNAPVR
jgi:hypothetical protein